MASFYDDASLVVIPSGYKTSKVYAQKPTDGSGDLTFTRASSATRVAPNGLIEEVRTNLILRSQDFGNASWNVSNLTKTTGQSDPNNGTTGVLLTSTGTSSVYLYQTATGAGCMSVYAKAGTRSSFSLIPTNFTNGAFFNLATQTATASGVGSLAKIESVGGGWFRCSVAVSSSTNMLFALTDVNGAGAAIGDTMSFAFAQFETGDIATNYIPTTTAAVSVGPVSNVPRLDYLGSSCPRLLLEPQRTNLVTNSENIGAANWTNYDSTDALNVTATLDPSGYNGADKLQETTANALHYIAFQNNLMAAANTYTFSAFLKAAERNWGTLYIYDGTSSYNAYFNLATGTKGSVTSGASSTIESYGNGWYRCSVTRTFGGSSLANGGIIIATANNTISYTGTTGSGIYVWGAQVEAGAYATSYIPTLGASVTRVADAASKTGISSLIGQTEGTLFVDTNAIPAGANQSALAITDGTTNNRIWLRFASNNILNAVFITNNVVVGAINTSIIANNSRMKIAFGYKNSDFALYVNGALVGSQSSGTLAPSAAFSTVGFNLFPTQQNHESPVSQALLFTTRLTNAQLAELTTL